MSYRAAENGCCLEEVDLLLSTTLIDKPLAAPGIVRSPNNADKPSRATRQSQQASRS